ncbi:MAG TPA: AAA family ATPase, partial [Burkholderiaceae bacterium]|nr:AAA family ATPase [Burkholderiaceae bacterium]
MRIDSIRLENYRCHADLTVEFGPGFNVIVGVNGSGKTSLLSAICDALNGLFRHRQFPGMPEVLADEAVRLLVMRTGGRFQFEPQYPVKIAANAVESDATTIRWSVERSSQVSLPMVEAPPAGQVRSLPSFGARPTLALSLLVFYRANRHWSYGGPPELQAAMVRSSRADGYANWWNASLDGAAFLTWVVAKHIERLAELSDGGEQARSTDDDELAVLNIALGRTFEDFLCLRYDFKRKSVLVEWLPEASRDPTPFENLSDGQKAVIGLVADIARRMCL